MSNLGSNRLFATLRANKQILQLKSRCPQNVRKSHGYYGYREFNYEPNRPYIQRLMHFNAAIMWCYMYWSWRHNWRELVGEYIWPNRDLWSDEHLGIPADDED